MSDLSDDFARMRTRTPVSPTPVAGPSYIRTAPAAQTQEEFLRQYTTWNIMYASNPITAGPPPQPPAVMQYTSPRNRPLPPTPPSPVVRLPREPVRHNQGLFEGSRLGKSIANKPDTFDGDKAKFRNWYRGVQWYLMGFDNMPSAWQTILITLSYMKGENAAGQYADLFAETRDINMTVEEFEKDLIATFQPASLK